jgi:Kef-type K+ transport system membrane component KefB
MTTLLGLIAFLFIAYISSIIYKKINITNIWTKSFAYTGTLYILIGVVTGPYLLNIINKEIIMEMSVLYGLVLGWAGLLIGLQFNIKNLKRFKLSYYGFAALNFFITIALIYIILYWITDAAEKYEMLILVVAASITSPIMIGLVTGEKKLSASITHLLQFNAAFDNLLGVIVFGLFVALNSEVMFNDVYDIGMFILIVPVLVSYINTIIYKKLSVEFKKEEEITLLLLGLLILLVGVSIYTGQSVIFISFLFGAFLGNSELNTRKLYLSIQELEKPLYILLLIFVGANITIKQFDWYYYLVLFIIIHIAIKLLANYVSKNIVKSFVSLPKSLGLANIGLGGLSMAIILDYHINYLTQYSSLTLFIIALSLIINDQISLWYLDKKLIHEK